MYDFLWIVAVHVVVVGYDMTLSLEVGYHSNLSTD
jgi:hypothetical protein